MAQLIFLFTPLYRLNQEPTLYVHLQKRNMKVKEGTNLVDKVLIRPNFYEPLEEEISDELVLKYTKDKLIYMDYLKLRLKNLKRKIVEKVNNFYD